MSTGGFATPAAAQATDPGSTPRNLAGSFGRAAAGAAAFALPRRGLPAGVLETFFEGHRLFNVAWVAAPSRLVETDGLGPVFNRVGCGRCHVANGRGRPPSGPEEPLTTAVLRLGIVAGKRVLPDPVYGRQLQSRALPGVRPEGYGQVRWRMIDGAYADGTPYRLRAPVLAVRSPRHGPLDRRTVLSLRVASPVFGVGALARIPRRAILAHADPGDRDGDGISGRAAWIETDEKGSRRLGRFGWKARRTTIHAQTARALSQDMGLTTRMFPRAVCARGAVDCLNSPSGRQPEVRAVVLENLAVYLRNLAVPHRRNVTDKAVIRGDRLFSAIGCGRCHRRSMPMLRPAKNQPAGASAATTEVIHPFTDLLLHDMGSGLSDGLPEGAAAAGEWRTPPLWGIGLAGRVNGNRFYLHDGRARTLAEAILWHGGEADSAQANFRRLSAADRAALIAFLRSL